MLKRRNYGRGHGYTLNGEKVPSVTGVIDTLPKPALINWAARVTAAHAVDHWHELAQLPPSQRLKELEDARWNINREATSRGTEIHALGERLAAGEEVEPGPHLGPAQAYADFCDRWEVEFLATEAPCASTRFKYAGTLDSIAIVRGLARVPEYAHLSELPVMLDLKTGKGVYESTALQLAAYAGCDIWQPDGPESEQPMPAIAGLFVAHILADDVALLPVHGDPEQLVTEFRYLMQTKRWLDDVKEAPPIGAPLILEGVHA